MILDEKILCINDTSSSCFLEGSKLLLGELVIGGSLTNYYEIKHASSKVKKFSS